MGLVCDFGDGAGADGASAFSYSETQAFVHGYRTYQLHAHGGVVAGNAHLGALRQADSAGHVSSPEIELRPIPIKERLVPPPSSFVKTYTSASNLS